MSRFAELGLSTYEEQCYRALVARGPMPARAVSDASGVPRGRVYDVLNGLDARDLVVARPGDPTTYAAVDPETAADRLLAERERDLAEQAARYERLADGLADALPADPPAEGRFWNAPLGSETAVSLTRQVFADADATVRSAMGRPYSAAPWDRFEPELAAFDDTRPGECTVRVLLAAAVLDAVPAAARARYRDRDAVSVRVTDGLAATFDIVDASRAYFHVPHPLDEGERLGAVELRDDATVDRLGERFDEAWERADSLSDYSPAVRDE